MFELTISTSIPKNKDIYFIRGKLSNLFSTYNGIITCEEYDGRIKLALAFPRSKSDYFLGEIFDVVAEAILRSYKEQYLAEILKHRISNKLTLATLVKVLTMFDKNSDKLIIKKFLKPDEEILMDSIYHFRLWELEKKWNDIAGLVADNTSYLMVGGAFIELMRFLILSTDAEFDEVHVRQKEGYIYGLSKDGKEVFKIDSTDKNHDKHIDIVSELIGLAPEKVVLYDDLNDKELFNYILTLFESKTVVIK